MTRSARARLALAITGLLLAANTAALVLAVMALSSSLPPAFDPGWESVHGVATLALFSIVAGVVASRRPDNAVGWVLLGLASLGTTLLLSYIYAVRGLLIAPGSLPGAGIGAWLTSWLWLVMFTLLPLLFLLFPDGRLPSARWRPVAWLTLLPVVLMVPVAAATSGVAGRALLVEDDLEATGWSSVVEGAAMAVLVVTMLAAILSLVVRYRRGSFEQRQQLKWVALAGALLGANGLLQVAVPGLEVLKDVMGLLSFPAIPLSVAIAILKYRLYDIDRIINRALVYVALSAALLSVYLVCVVVLQGLLSRAAATSDLAVAASTLAVAALFRPARGRIQSFIDRRFYRSRYDAARTLDDFGARLRDEVDLEALTEELLEVVRRTLHPAHASLWLRVPERGR